MRTWFRGFLITASLLACTPASDGIPEEVATDASGLRDSRYSDAFPAIGRVDVSDGSCTGVLIADRIVLTAAHCVNYKNDAAGGRARGRFYFKQNGKWYYSKFDGHRRFGRSVGGDDLALLHLTRPISPYFVAPLALAPNRPERGTRVSVWGFGSRNCDLKGNGGTDGTWRKQVVYFNWGSATNVTCPGDSGGPVVWAGSVVAVTSGSYADSQGRDVEDIWATVPDDIQRLRKVIAEWLPEASATMATHNPNGPTEVPTSELPPPDPVESTETSPPPVDTAAPWVSLVGPANGSWVRGLVPLSASAGDNSGSVRVEFVANAHAFGSIGAPPFSAGFESRSVADGAVLLEAAAWDSAGNSARSGITVQVDNTAPAVAITSPGDGALVAGTVTLSASGSDTNLKDLEFFINGSFVGRVAAASSSTAGSVSWNSRYVADSAVTLTVVAHDHAGNASQQTRRLLVDNTAPYIEVLSPMAGAPYTGNLSLRANVTDPNLAWVSFTSPAGGCNFVAAPFACDVSVLGLPDGNATFGVTAADTVNNTRRVDVSFVVDNTPPVVTLNTPATGSAAGRYVYLQATSPKAKPGSWWLTQADSVTSVSFYARWEDADVLIGTVSAGRYPWALLAKMPEQIPNGATVPVHAVATDTVYSDTWTVQHRDGRSGSNTVVVDRELAGVQVTEPNVDGYYFRHEDTLHMVADAWSGWGVRSVEFLLRVPGDSGGESIGVVTAPPYELGLDLMNMLGGDWELVARAHFNEGTTAESVRFFQIQVR